MLSLIKRLHNSGLRRCLAGDKCVIWKAAGKAMWAGGPGLALSNQQLRMLNLAPSLTYSGPSTNCLIPIMKVNTGTHALE